MRLRSNDIDSSVSTPLCFRPVREGRLNVLLAEIDESRSSMCMRALQMWPFPSAAISGHARPSRWPRKLIGTLPDDTTGADGLLDRRSIMS